MSDSASSPGPLVQLALALKEQNDRRNAYLKQACAMVGRDASAADKMLAQALQMNEEFFRAEEAFLKQVPWGAQQLADRNNFIREETAMILMAQAQAATIMGRYKEAGALYQQVLGLLDPNHAVRPSVLAAKADVAMRELSDGDL